MSDEIIKRLAVGDAGHHVPSVRKSRGRIFEVSRLDKTRPTILPKGEDAGHLHWRLHEAERQFIGPRQGDFNGTDEELFEAYRKAYRNLNDIRIDVKSPDETWILGLDVTPFEAVNLMENRLKEQGLWKTEN